MWQWFQGLGEMHLDGSKFASGYAGMGDGQNNPDMQHVIGIGPLPRGFYVMMPPADNPSTGPYSIRLISSGPPPDWTGDPSLEKLEWMFGRADFLIHADSIEHPGAASHGCIVPVRRVNGETGRKVREAIWATGGNVVEVLA